MRDINDMIDVNFDFTSDTPGYWAGYWDRCNGLGGCGKYDPDSYSPTLLEYTQKLYNRRLPNGQKMELTVPERHTYFVWNDMYFSCDSITCSFRYWGTEKLIWPVYNSLPDYKSTVEKFVRESYTLPGEIIFPMHRNSMNQRRGMHPRIKDRWDLTLECIRRFYEGIDNPLNKILESDRAFYELFVDFKGYVDFFFLNDCVSGDYSKVNIWLDDLDFSKKALPQTVEDYFTFMNGQRNFLEARRRRMQVFIQEHGL